MKSLTSTPNFGEILSLVTALVWATAVIFFKKSGEAIHPAALNLFKNLLAVTLYIPTLLIAGIQIWGERQPADYWLALASGAIGIGVADTLFFFSLNLLGAGLTAIVDCLYSPMVILLSILMLDDRMTFTQFIGAAVIVTAVLVTLQRGKRPPGEQRRIAFGVVFGIVAMALMAFGVVMVKPLLNRAPLLWTTQIRLMGGTVILMVFLPVINKRWDIIGSLRSAVRRRDVWIGSLLGAYLAMMLWLGGMKFTSTSVASALNQTSNVFIFLLAALILKEALTLKRIAAIALGVGGAFLVLLG